MPEDNRKIEHRVHEHTFKIKSLEDSTRKLSDSVEGLRKDLSEGLIKFDKKFTILLGLLIASGVFGDSVSKVITTFFF